MVSIHPLAAIGIVATLSLRTLALQALPRLLWACPSEGKPCSLALGEPRGQTFHKGGSALQAASSVSTSSPALVTFITIIIERCIPFKSHIFIANYMFVENNVQTAAENNACHLQGAEPHCWGADAGQCASYHLVFGKEGGSEGEGKGGSHVGWGPHKARGTKSWAVAPGTRATRLRLTSLNGG